MPRHKIRDNVSTPQQTNIRRNTTKQTSKSFYRQVNRLVFQTIYERGGNASDMETLVSVAEEAGLPSADAHAFLSSSEGEEEVLREDNRAKTELDIRGVPFFVVRRATRRDEGQGSAAASGDSDGEPRVVLNGAVAPEELLRAFESVSRR